MEEKDYKTCVNCVISRASGFGRRAMAGVPTCRRYHTNYMYDELRGTYEECRDVELRGLCKYEKEND